MYKRAELMGWRFFKCMALIGMSFGQSMLNACECAQPGNIYQRKSVSDLAFEGQAVSQVIDSVRGNRTTRFEVKRALMGGRLIEVDELEIQSSIWGVACGTGFPLGAIALVFVQKMEKEKGLVFSTSACAHNIISPSKQEVDSVYDGKGLLAKKHPEPKWKTDFLNQLEKQKTSGSKLVE